MRSGRMGLASAAIMVSVAAVAPAQEELWVRDFGGAAQDGAYAIEATQDGGYVVAGFSETFSPGSFIAAYVVKTDAAGELEWAKSYEPSDAENIAAAVRQLPDGGYAIAGRTGFNGGFDSFLLRTDAEGNELWQKEYDAGDDDRAHALALTSDGGFILAGQAWFPEGPFGNYDYWVVKTDGEGNLEWARSFEYNDDFAPGADVALAVEEVSAGGYVIAGFTNTIVWDGWVVRTDALGNVIWDQNYGGGSSGELSSIRELDDGGFILCGSFATNFGDVDIALVRTDESGQTQWTKTFGLAQQDDVGQSVRVMPDGGFVLTGYTSSFGADGWNLYTARTDAVGEAIWTSVHGGNSDDRGHAVAIGDEAIVAAGWAWSFGAGQGDLHLVAYDDPALGCAADMNADGSLDILDFIAFQNAFTAQDPEADCDGDGDLSILDFICFQNLFMAGCA